MKKQGLNNLFYLLKEHWDKRKTKPTKKSTHSMCNVQWLLQPYFPNVYCSAAEVPLPKGTLTLSLGAEREHEKHKFLLQCRFPESSSVIHLISLCINSMLQKGAVIFHSFQQRRENIS